MLTEKINDKKIKTGKSYDIFIPLYILKQQIYIFLSYNYLLITNITCAVPLRKRRKNKP